MSCPTTITPAPIPGINDMRAVTARGLADAATLLREAVRSGDGMDDEQTEMHCRALAAVQRAAKLLTERDEVLEDAVQSARLQADMIGMLQDELAQAREVLSDCATTLEGYARHHAERGPEHAHKVALNAELAAKGE